MHAMGSTVGWMLSAGVVWVLLAIGALWGAVRLIRQPPPRPRSLPSPLDIIERRFAAGEMTREEFDDARARLREHGLDL